MKAANARSVIVGLSCVVAGGLAVAVLNAVPGIAASIGKTQIVVIAAPASSSTEEMRASYRRPETIPFPKDNPYTVAKAELGKKLYFDTRLSSSNVLACATCHNPGYGWGDGQPVGVGHGMKALGRRSPSIINAAYGQIFMWDSRFGSLEEQALGPIESDAEMHMPLDELVKRINALAEYKRLFAVAFPDQPVVPKTVAKAIAVYERTVVSGRAPFDAWVAGDDTALSPEARRGFVTFNTKGKCAECHSGWNFTDDSSHDIGLAGSDVGRGKFLPDVEKMQFAFKTPGLREIARRGPYMHDGSLATLGDVIEHYNKGGIDRGSRSDLMAPLALTGQEKTDLVAFLMTLTSDADPTMVPSLPR